MTNKSLAEIKIGNINYDIRATVHSQERMLQRNIDEFVVVASVLALGKNKLAELSRTNEDAMIIDEDSNTSVLVAVKHNKITIITVIDKSNIFVKKNTKIIKL